MLLHLDCYRHLDTKFEVGSFIRFRDIEGVLEFEK